LEEKEISELAAELKMKTDRDVLALIYTNLTTKENEDGLAAARWTLRNMQRRGKIGKAAIGAPFDNMGIADFCGYGIFDMRRPKKRPNGFDTESPGKHKEKNARLLLPPALERLTDWNVKLFEDFPLPSLIVSGKEIGLRPLFKPAGK